MKSYQRGYRRFLTFAAIGCFNTFMDCGTFALLNGVLLAPPAISQAFGYLVGAICSFLLHGRITFGDGQGLEHEKLLRFVMWDFASLTASSMLMCAVTHLGLSAFYAKIFVTLEAALVDYFGLKHLVFQVQRSDRREQA